MISITIRPLRESDFESLAQLWNQETPENTTTAAKIESMMTIPATYLKPGCVVAEQDNVIVGLGTYRWSQHLTNPPVKFWNGYLISNSNPQLNQAAILNAIFQGLERSAADFGQPEVYAVVREDNSLVALYQKRGYSEEMRSFGAELDVDAFDATPYGDYSSQLGTMGIAIRTLSELKDEHQRIILEFNAPSL